MPKWLILLSALLVSPVSGAPAWTWVDANGTVHFSDTPVPGARQIELTGAQGFGQPGQSDTTQRAPAPAATDAAPAASPYRTLAIVSPAANETLWSIGATLNVQIEIEPRLQTGHRIDVALDGQRRNLNATALQVSLPEVFRGIHTLEALVVDTRGIEIARSAPVSFIVQQTSILNPNSLPARRNAAGN